MVHVYPVDDLYQHYLDGGDCPCDPVIEWKDVVSGAIYDEPLCIHRSWDGREIIEQAQKIIEGAPT